MKMNETIRSRRKERNLTQEQVADYLGVTAPAVHKWEKGTSYPDVTLLPALARLLGVDLNTLFSFEKELTEQEINTFLNEVLALMQDEGFTAGYEKAINKIREFPNCAGLLYSAATFLDGSLVLFLVEETSEYEAVIEHLYERAAELGDTRIREQASHMLILKYMKRKDFEKAEKLLETLPDTPVDKQNLKAVLMLQKNQVSDALRIYEEKLCFHANGVLNTLLALLNCFQKLDDGENAALCARKAKEIVKCLGLWEYSSHLADYEIALYQKDREGTLAALRMMLKSMQETYQMAEFPLYKALPKKEKEGNVQGLMASAIVSGLKKGYGLDESGFLQGDVELEKILEEFGGMAD